MHATMAQQVARILGKDEVGGSSPLSSLRVNTEVCKNKREQSGHACMN